MKLAQVFSFDIFIIARRSLWGLGKFSKAMTVCEKIKGESCVSKEMEVCSYVLLWPPNRLCDQCRCKEMAVYLASAVLLASFMKASGLHPTQYTAELSR